MKYCCSVFVACLLVFSDVKASEPLSLSYYFDANIPLDQPVSFDPDVPTPESVLGYQVGEWHVRPEQIAEYMYALAKTSKRVWVEEMGRSWEQRPLLLVSFSSPGHIEQLETIRRQQLDFEQRSKNSPAVVWMGYSVHGNEASGANAALLLAYYLAAAQGEQIERLLNDTVILLDPMLNPDGMARFANWVNARKSEQRVIDPNDIEHREYWPQGRGNHYWFDLNRDWLLAQHPESQARLNYFHKWKPVVLTDFHEMGTNSSYFFQPGVPSRNNPLTPKRNFELTADIAQFHARAFDALGSTYFTKEGFDDFYFGKGSTYPDINGAIGILFEQASARGHAQDSKNGVVTFPFAIRNQLAASFSTLKAVLANKQALMSYQKEFYRSAVKEAKGFPIKGYVYQAGHDKTRLEQFNRILQQHQIQYYQLSRSITLDDRSYDAANAYIVPLQQPQFRLIRALFETRTEFEDNTFYDVSSWNLAMAFNLTFSALGSGDFSARLLAKPGSREQKKAAFLLQDDTVAVAFDWRDSATSQLVYQLSKQGFKLIIAGKSSQWQTTEGVQSIPAGSFLMPLGLQPLSREELAYRIGDLLKEVPVAHWQITSGLARQGIDLGSPNMIPFRTPKPLLVVGPGVSSYEAGEVWHLFDQVLKIPLVKVEQEQLSQLQLHYYTHIILVSGNYQWDDAVASKISDWIDHGGHLIVSRTAGKWLSQQSWSPITEIQQEQQPLADMSYAEREGFITERLVGGAIVKTLLDNSHPLTFGLETETLPVFRRGNDRYRTENNPFATVARYPDRPLLSGYMSAANQQQLASTPAVVAVRKKQGSVIYFADDMNFRAFWLGSRKLFINGVFLADTFESSVD
jgi:hypothetical protein